MDAVTAMATEKGKNLLNLEDNLQKVETKLKRLKCRASDFMEEVVKEEQTGKKKRKREVEDWFQEVQQVENGFIGLKNKLQEDGFLRNLFTGDSLANIHSKVKELMKQSKCFHGHLLTDNQDSSRGEPRVITTKLFGTKFQEGMERIWNWLVTDDLCNMGIYGMGGVGKTTLAKHIHNELLERTDFNVYWLTVSQKFCIKKLQGDIAKLIKLDFSDADDEDVRASMLSRFLLADHHQSVFIFDDVWEEFSPEMIGISPGVKKCRLILTTRSLQLCYGMHCQRKLNVTTLDANEAWNLFKHTLGPVSVILPKEVKEIAKLVVRRCSGLPLGIITVAGSMRGITDRREWSNALEQLKKYSDGFEEMEEKVFPILEWSFNRLKGCERICFLHCCLYPEDYLIDREEVVNLFVLAELIPRRETREIEFNHGHTVINKLVRVCLLEEVIQDGKFGVKMHDLIRDMALIITCGKSKSNINTNVPKFLVKSIGAESRKVTFEQKEWSEDLNAVSVISYQGLAGRLAHRNVPSRFIHGFTETPLDHRVEIPPGMLPACPNLSTFLFPYANVERFPDSFFLHMTGLKVLNLRRCEGIKKLPDCISNLVNLTALLLEGCLNLKSIPPLGKLKQLRDLDLSDTGVECVPCGLEKLINLERLSMRATRLKDKIIVKGTFSELHHLQTLELPAHIRDPEVLKQLKVFRGHLAFADFYNKIIVPQDWPKHYEIIIMESTLSNDSEDDLFYSYGKRLVFKKLNFREGLDEVLPLEEIQELGFVECNGFSDGLLQPFISKSSHLYDLTIRCADKIQFLLYPSSLSPSEFASPLQNLTQLRLLDMPNFTGLINCDSSSSSLTSIKCENELYPRRYSLQRVLIPYGTFSSLKLLIVFRCHKLKKLFPEQLSLQNLENLYVNNCEQMEQIATSTEVLRLPKLQALHLRSLPLLVTICEGTIACDSIINIVVSDCPKLKKLPMSPFPPRSLKAILGSKLWWESLEWDTPGAKDSLQPLFKG